MTIDKQPDRFDRKIASIERRRIKSGEGAVLKLVCGHERWVGGFPKDARPLLHRCLACEDQHNRGHRL